MALRDVSDGLVDEELPEEPAADQGGEEPAAEEQSPLEQLMAEKGISAERAAELLAAATDEDAQERQREEQARRELESEEYFEDRFKREGGQRFANYVKDRSYAERVMAHIRANHPDLVGGAPAEEEDPDPVARSVRQMAAELASIKRELAETRGATDRVSAESAKLEHKREVGTQLGRFLDRSVDAQKHEDFLMEELHEAWTYNPRMFRRPEIDVPAFLKMKLERVSRARGGDPAAERPRPRTTSTAPRTASGRPSAAPARNKLPDLSPHGLAREFAKFREEHGLDED